MGNPSNKLFELCTYGMLKSNRKKLIKAVSDEIESNSTPFRKDDLKRLVETLSSTRLGVAPSDPQREIIGYVRRFIEVIYEIETLLDEAAVHKAGQKFRGISVIGSWRSRRRFSSDLNFLLEKLQSSAPAIPRLSSSSRLKDTPDDPSTLSMKTRGEVETTYYHYQQPEESIVGREEEKERLIRCILNPSANQQHPAVIAVTGPRGIGKTTLVNLVCNDSRVSSSFDSVLWASLVQDPYSPGLTFNFLQSDVQESSFCTQENYTESFKHRLSHYLRGRKFLLVLDTALYWFKYKYKEVLEHLDVGSTGSTVILTTSLFSDIGRFTEVIRLEGIPEEECWSLFKRYSEFDGDAKRADPVLKDIGRSLVNRCCGSPLAVKILASSLRNSRDRHYWEQLNQSKLWGQRDKTLTALYLSLEQVPIELMTCYATSSFIARGNSASRDQMVYFWMAQGLLQSGEVNEDLRDVGNRYCNELLSMGLLQLDRTDYVTPVCVSSEMLAIDIHPFWRQDDQNLSLISGRERTFLLRDFRVCVVSKPFLKDLISNMKLLCILLLDHYQFEELPETIGNLKHLRYLSLAGNHKLQALPHSICKLLNLQTLDLSGCVQLEALPRNMHQLVSLRHLLLSLKLTMIPEEAHTSWKQLRHLKICNCQYLDSLKEGMQNLTALRALGIHDCPSIASLPNSINRLTNLKELSILNCQNLDLTGWEGLLQLRSLKSLRIQGLPKLLELPDGLQFVADSLQHLLISNCESLRMLPASLEHCTSLVEIIIESCPNLFALPQCTRALRNLRVLKIYRCPKLVQRYQMETGDDWQLISHIPMIYLDGEVSRNKASSTQQEQPGCLNTPIECQSRPSSGEIRPASATSPSEISPALEIEHPIQHYSPSPSEHITFSPPIEGAAEHPDPAPVEHSHEPALVPLIHHRDHATDLENRGADYNEQRLGKRVLDLEKEVEGKTLLFLFGECCEFEKEMLIQLWMALGLLTDEPMEEIGAKYFEKLVCEGYILYSDIGNSLYKVNTGKLNTELGMITHRRNYAMLTNGSQNVAVSAETLQVSVVCDEIDESIFTTLGRLYRLRVLLFLRNYGSRLQEVPRDMFLCNGSLVALDLSGAHIKELPSSVEKMIHLRFLDLSWTFLERLPERIDHFEKLQTLKLKGCYRLHRLPKELKGLTELRHLDLDVLGQLASFPEGIGTLVNLRTLSAFPVGIEEGFKISELKYLDNLTGEFCIANLENVNSANEAKEASLTAKRSIKQLELRWSDHQFQEPKNEEEAILESLCPYSDLEEIQILCYPGTSFPGWITDVSFHKLVSITMFKCVHVSVLPSFEKLPSLISLELTGLNSVENVNFKGGVDHVGFPRLQKLAVDEMLNVESWGEALEGDYPCLVNVSIKDCPKLPELPSLPYLPSIKLLEVCGCTKLAFLSDKELSKSLLQLIVEDCPLIKERCSDQEGQDWYKIEQVQTMWIDQVEIKTNEDLINDDDGGDDDDDDDDDCEEDDDDDDGHQKVTPSNENLWLGHDQQYLIKQEVYVHGHDMNHQHDHEAIHDHQMHALRPSTWSHMVLPVSSPKSCVTTLSSNHNNNINNNIMDFSSNSCKNKQQVQCHSSECNSPAATTGGASKKPRVQSSSIPPLKVRKEKLGDRITALHQLVSPFGKTDTASVLLETIGCIRYLQGQIQALSSPYFSNPPSKNHHFNYAMKDESLKDLRSKGLCLVPISCTQVVGSDNNTASEYWAPSIGGGF